MYLLSSTLQGLASSGVLGQPYVSSGLVGFRAGSAVLANTLELPATLHTIIAHPRCTKTWNYFDHLALQIGKN